MEVSDGRESLRNAGLAIIAVGVVLGFFFLTSMP